MKKIFQLLALFACFTAAAQDQNCPGEKIELLNGKTLKVKPISEALQKIGYQRFFSDADLKKVYKKSGSNTEYAALAGKELKVISYEPYVSLGKPKFKLLLETPEKDRIYYDYSPAHCGLFPFETIGGLDLPAGFYCNTIISGKTSYGVNYYETKGADGVSFVRFFDSKGIQDVIQVNNPSMDAGQKGLSVQLSNNVKIERPDASIGKIPNGVGGDAFTALIILTADEAKLVKDNEIVKTKIGNVESDVKTGKMLNSYFNCMIEKAPLASAAVKSGGDNCPEIETEKGKTEGDMHYSTPAVDGVSVKKISRGGSQTYICTLRIVSKTRQKGTFVTIMFDNNKSIDKPAAKISEGEQKDKNYEYFAMFIVDEKEMNLFKESTVKGLMVMDETLIVKQKEKLKKLITCLIDK